MSFSTLLCALALCLSTTSLLAQSTKKPPVEKKQAEKKPAPDKAAVDKAAAEKKTTDEKAAADKKAAEDKAAAAPQTTRLGIGTSLRGGTIKQVTITSAVVTRIINGTPPKYKDNQGFERPLAVGDTLENLKIESATIISAVAAGGTVKWPKPVEVDLARKTVKADEVADTTLQGTILEKAKVTSGSQNWKINGVKGPDISAALELDLSNVNIGKVTIAGPELSPSALGDAGISTATAPPKINPKGDYFQLRTPLVGFAPKSDDAVPGTLTARKNMCFRVTHELDKNDPADSNKKIKYLRGTFEVSGKVLTPKFVLPPYDCPELALDKDACPSCSPNEGEVSPHVSYDILRETLIDKADYYRYGWTYGFLAAPFKYFWNAGHEFSAGASVGPYFGYQQGDAGGSGALVLSVGATSATIKNADGTSTERNGMTFAVALLFQVKDDFSFGIINGWDFFAKTDGVPNNGRPWLSVTFGTKFN